MDKKPQKPSKIKAIIAVVAVVVLLAVVIGCIVTGCQISLQSEKLTMMEHPGVRIDSCIKTTLSVEPM